MKKRLCFIVSSPMTVNAFLLQPIKRLSEYYDIYLILNLNTTDTLDKLGNAVTVLPVRIDRKISMLRDLCALWVIFRLCRHYKFNVVHSVTPKAGLLAMFAAALARVDIRIHTFTGQVWAAKSGLSRYILKNFDKLIGHVCTNILVDSPSQRQFLLDEGVITQEKSGVLQKGSISGVDIKRFKPDSSARLRIREDMQIASESIVFLFIGRLNRDKGVLDLAVAFSNVARKHANVRLLMVGVDEANLLGEIQRITSNCENKVKFIEFTPVPEEYMAASDVLCLPSYREGFGNVIIEAAAVGLPTIGSKIYGITDAIVDGETGLLFEARDVAALESCMENIVNDNQLRINLGMAAHKRVCEDFSSQKLSSAWLKYYQELS